jgi:hypothetical protein
MANMTINGKEAREILSAIEIARSECGEGFETLEKKILTTYPEIVKEREDNNSKVVKICNEQHTRRKYVIDNYNSEVKHPTVRNVIDWYLTNEKFIRENYSDEICFAGDLFEYTPRTKLNELIVSLRESKGRNDYENQLLKERKDMEMWHSLIPFIEQATYLERVKKAKK